MAIYTPRGLKIRLPLNYAFALIARLYPKVDAFKVLQTTEALENIPAVLSVIIGFVCFYLQLSFFKIGLYVFLGTFAGFLLTTFGLYVIPGLVSLGRIYSNLFVSSILYIILVVYGFINVGWMSIIIFFIGKIVAEIPRQIIELIQTRTIYKKIEHVLTLSERNFLNAYRLHAVKLNKTTDVGVSDNELNEENWKPVYEDLAYKWPEVVRRFTEVL